VGRSSVLFLGGAETADKIVTRLAERIAELIVAEGPLSIAQYMTMCLHDPEGGAYAGLDQVNVTLPSTLKGRGQLIVTVTVNGQATNMAQLLFQ